MQKQPTLVIMAAGMGSRFGGLKQMTPVDTEGHFIIDFSLFDAYRAGFRRVVFIIKREMEQLFRTSIGDRLDKWFEIQYVYQELTDLPAGFRVPEGRVKPWGTAHAVLSCRNAVDGPFAVINADDFYGRTAFQTIYAFLAGSEDENVYAMVAYRLRNTVTEFGSVARGVCQIKDGFLADVTERTKIYKRGEDAAYTEDGSSFIPISGDTLVSMNFWGFTTKMLRELQDRFPAFLENCLQENPLKGEYFLPSVVNRQLEAGSASVRVLPCEEQWHGVTYHEDLESVVAAIERLKKEGIYTQKLWE